MNQMRIHIQRALIAMARDWECPVVVYGADASTPEGKAEIGLPQPITEQTKRVLPGDVSCNEKAAAWVPDTHFGRGVRQRRSVWAFTLFLSFNQEVLVEELEDALTRDVLPITIPNHQTLFARLQLSEYDHPTRSGGPGGTAIQFTVEISDGRTE